MHSMRSAQRQVELRRLGNQLPVLGKANSLCTIVKCCVFWPVWVKDISGYRRSGEIGVASRRCTTLPVAPLVAEKNTNSRFSRFFVRSVPLFRSLMLTPMHVRFVGTDFGVNK